MPKENITYTEKMAQKILRSSSIKRMRMKFIRSQEPISATKIMTDSDLKRFKSAHGLYMSKSQDYKQRYLIFRGGR